MVKIEQIVKFTEDIVGFVTIRKSFQIVKYPRKCDWWNKRAKSKILFSWFCCKTRL